MAQTTTPAAPEKNPTPTSGSPAQDKTAATKAQGQSTASTAKTEAKASGICCYIGPTIRGLIRNGDVFRGTREDALKQAHAAIEAQPLVKTLIVTGESLPSARLRVKTPGNALYENYRRVAGKE